MEIENHFTFQMRTQKITVNSVLKKIKARRIKVSQFQNISKHTPSTQRYTIQIMIYIKTVMQSHKTEWILHKIHI